MGALGRVNSVRLLAGFANAGAAQIKVLEMVAAEAERIARDAMLLALDNLREEQGIKLTNEQVAVAFNSVSSVPMPSARIPTLTKEAKARRQRRERIKDPFRVMDSTIKSLRGEIANAERQKD